jgi:hypothetical protein
VEKPAGVFVKRGYIMTAGMRHSYL